MISRLRRYRRLSVVPIATLCLLAYYLFVFMPLGRRAQAIDVPLRKAWLKLASTLDLSNPASINFQQITNQLSQTRDDLAVIDETRRKVAERLELPQAIRSKMASPFQLSDYQVERSRKIDDLAKLAKQQQVAIDPVVLVGFPEHTADMAEPALLWPALHFVDGLLTTAVKCKVTALHALDVPVALTNAPSELVTIPVQLEFSGPGVAVDKFLRTLPLRDGEELKALAVLEPPAEKAPLFIERLILKKQSPDKPDDVRVLLRATGFVFRQ